MHLIQQVHCSSTAFMANFIIKRPEKKKEQHDEA